MLRRNLDLVVLECLAIAGWLAQLGTLPAPARVILGLCLVLVCPGYGVMAALFPNPALGRPERLLVSAGLSLAIVILTGVVLNAAPAGLNTTTWSTVLVAVTVAASCLAVARRDLSPTNSSQIAGNRLHLEQWALFGIAGFVAIASLVLARAPRPPTNVVGYTALWLVPDQDPSKAALHLGVSSNELEVTHYRLTLLNDGREIQTWDEISLAPGEKWESQVNPPIASAGNKLEAILYRTSAPETVYRDVVLAR